MIKTPTNLNAAIRPTAAGGISAAASVTRTIQGTALRPSPPHTDETMTAAAVASTTTLMTTRPRPQLAIAQTSPAVVAR